MGETMDFPKTPLEFIEKYRIIDNEEVYTNGSVLVPMLRVRQMIEHYFPRWIPVTERLPEEPAETVDEHGMRYFTPMGRYLAVVKKTNAVCQLGYTYSNKTFWYGNSLNKVEITHWMPLPEPPEVE